MRYEAGLKTGDTAYFERDDFLAIIDYYFNKGKWDKAVIVVNQAKEQHPYSANLLLKKAILHINKNELELAHTCIEDAKILDASEIEIPLVEARLFIELGQIEKAELVLKTSLRGASINDAEVLLLELADLYAIWHKGDKEFEALAEILQTSPESMEAFERMSICVEHSGMLEESIVLHKTLIDKHPYNYWAWYNLGISYSGLELYEKAIDALSYALAIKDDFEPAIRETAECYYDLDQFERALEFFLQSASFVSFPDEELYHNIGYTHYHLKNYKKSLFYLNKSLKINPQYDNAYFAIGEVHKAQGQYKDALTFYYKAIKLDEDNSQYLEAYAMLSYELGNYQTAIEFLVRALEANPQDSSLWMVLAKCYYELDYFSEAFDVLKKGIELLGEEVELIYASTLVLFKMGRNQSATELLSMALTLDHSAHHILVDWDEELVENRNLAMLIDEYNPNRQRGTAN